MDKSCNHCNEQNEQIEQNESFAMELLKEYSAQAKRWFIIAMVELGLILSIIGGAVYIFSTSEFSYTELSTEGGGNANYVSESKVGDINNGTN